MDKVKPDWQLLKVDYTWACNKEFLDKLGVEKCGTIYLVDANLRVHICSLTPNIEAWAVQAFIEYRDDVDTDNIDFDDEFELSSGLTDEVVSYLDTKDLDKHSFAPASKYISIDPEETTQEIVDGMVEYLAGSPV